MKKYQKLFLDKNFQIFIILIISFCIYFPLTFLGYGTDNDSYGVVNSAEILINKHYYQPSRNPGYFIHEIFSAILIFIGKSTASNLGTLVMSLLAIFFFMKICLYYNIKNIFLISLLLIIHPVYWANSTCTIDYIWAIGFFLTGYYFFIMNNYALSVLFFSLSIGTRITSVLLIFSVLFINFIITRDKKNILLFASTLILSSVFYIPQFINAGSNFSFLTYYIGDWNFSEYFIRFIYKNIYFLGLAAFLYTIVVISLNFKNFMNILVKKEEIQFISILILFLFELLFFKIPLENEYLLPVLPFFLIIFSRIFEKRRIYIYILLILLFSYNLININILKADIKNNAKNAEIGIFIEKGYLLADIENRIKAGKINKY